MQQCDPPMNKDSTISIKSVLGGATAPSGFVSGGVVCGVRNSGRKDLGLLYSEHPCSAAGVFTRNAFKGAPLSVYEAALSRPVMCGLVVVNSGNANAATGEQGVAKTPAGCRTLASESLGLESRQVAVASTGVIGQLLPMQKIEAGISGDIAGESGSRWFRLCGGDPDDRHAHQRGCGGDRGRWEDRYRRGDGEGERYDPAEHGHHARLPHHRRRRRAGLPARDPEPGTTGRTFNRVTVDGDTSPSDLALLLANGAAGNEPLTTGSTRLPSVRGGGRDGSSGSGEGDRPRR